MYKSNQVPTEKFSNSGLNISNRRCLETVGYYKPYDQSPSNKLAGYIKVCSPLRRYIIDESTGNYYSANGASNMPHPDVTYI